MKEQAKEVFRTFKYRKGNAKDREYVTDAYSMVFDERPTVQYVREAEGDLDEYCAVLVECLRKGEPYKMDAKTQAEIEKLDKEGVPHDGF